MPVRQLNLLQACREVGNEDRALMFCSTSKITFAGAGVAAMGMSAANFQRVKDYLFSMTITFDKVNQLRHVRFLQREGGLKAQMKRQAALIFPKFEQVFKSLQEGLGGCGPIARWTTPKGGYFISLYTMDGCAKRVVALCKQAGVVLTGAGAAYPYGVDPADSHIRIAPTYPPIEELAQAADLLCITTRLASVEKLLQT
jgi:DNA-binding transcriptional MocR family regulator